MATARKRLTAQERIAAYKKKIKEIEQAEKNKGKKAKLTKTSEGLKELFELMDKVAKQHSLKMPQFVREVARLRRTGLKFAD